MKQLHIGQIGFYMPDLSGGKSPLVVLKTDLPPLEGAVPADTQARFEAYCPQQDIVLTFSQPVTNPVVHFSGMGGTYDSGRNSLGFTAEFDVITPGVTVTRLSGNSAFAVTGNSIVDNAAPITGTCSSNGAACGSARIVGSNLSSVTLRGYLRGDGGLPDWDAAVGHSVDGVLIGVSANISDMQPTFGASTPTVVRPGQVLTGLTLTCKNNGPSGASNATCAPSVDKGTISALACLPASSTTINFPSSIVCTFPLFKKFPPFWGRKIGVKGKLGSDSN